SVERYQEEKERALITLYSIGDGVIVTDEEGLVEYLNPVAEQLTGWISKEAAGRRLPEIFRITNEITGENADNPVEKCLKENNVVVLTEPTTLTRKDGHMFAIENSAAPIKNRDAKIIGVILVFHDVTEKKNLMNQMSHQAYHDALTGLPNRLLFNDRLNVAINLAKRDGQQLAVMFLDMDRFKMVNDMLGHAEGDMLLKDVARRLSESVRITDTLARLGGDEFTLVVSQLGSPEDAKLIGDKILQVFRDPFVISDHEFHLSVSIGVAIFPTHGTEPLTLMKHADTAMYHVKEQGGNNCQIYSRELDVNIEERLIRENSLRKALENEEFMLYYQPIVDVETGRVFGLEALLRWQHPELGLVTPQDFIPLAEEIGLIIPLGDWVLQQACAQNKAWQEAGYAPVRVTVNLSGKQFQKGDLVENVRRVLEETGLEAQWLELEITETVAMQNMDYTIKTLQQLGQMGVRFAIDDFGTGYSSLSYLRRFPIHTLKIDRSFIGDIVNNPEDAAIVSTIIVLANNLNLEIVAEGVEENNQVEFLRKRKCRNMQGYFFGRPMPPKTVENGFLNSKIY
ncbi:MAG TPA: EAL domain-containing protein, partial [Bacillota bacterium]|nr:EAL domain-containing protein [Bacillota bacterium]